MRRIAHSLRNGAREALAGWQSNLAIKGKKCRQTRRVSDLRGTRQLEKDYAETFGFNHGYGLGVLRKPGGDRDRDSQLVQLLFDSDPATQEKLRKFYVHVSKHLNNERLVKRLQGKSQGTGRKPQN